MSLRRQRAREESEPCPGVVADCGQLCSDETVFETSSEQPAFVGPEVGSERNRVVDVRDEMGEVAVILRAVRVM